MHRVMSVRTGLEVNVISKIFDIIDQDGSGSVTPDEILLFFRNISASSYIPVYAELQHDIRRTRHLAWMLSEQNEITALTDHFFADYGSKKVDFEMFLATVLAAPGASASHREQAHMTEDDFFSVDEMLSLDNLRIAFDAIDADRSGYVLQQDTPFRTSVMMGTPL